MLVPWMNPGVSSQLPRFTAKTSMQKVYDVHSPRRVKNGKQSGVERQTVQEPLKILPDSIPLTLANNYLKQYFPTLKTSQMRASTVYKPMRFFFLPLLLIIASQ